MDLSIFSDILFSNESVKFIGFILAFKMYRATEGIKTSVDKLTQAVTSIKEEHGNMLRLHGEEIKLLKEALKKDQ